MTFTVLSDRRLGIAVLSATTATLDGAQTISHDLPVGFGDFVIEDIMVMIDPIATLMASPEINGPRIVLMSAGAAAYRDLIGSPRWTVQGSAGPQVRIAARPELLHPIYMRETEVVTCMFAEVDTDASPTANLTILMRGARIRNEGLPAGPPPLQFTS